MIGVVKIGGAEGNKLGTLMSELAARVAGGEKWILVHGASGIMDRLCRERGVEIRMVTSPSCYRSRYVGEKERELFREAALAYGAKISDTLASFGAHRVPRPGKTKGFAGKKGHPQRIFRRKDPSCGSITTGRYQASLGKDTRWLKGIPILPPLAWTTHQNSR